MATDYTPMSLEADQAQAIKSVLANVKDDLQVLHPPELHLEAN